MSTGNQNLDLLVKLLNLTTSPNDGEALQAIRKANAQLTKFHTSWERFVKDRITVAADPFATPQSTLRSEPPKAPPNAPNRPPPQPTTPPFYSAPLRPSRPTPQSQPNAAQPDFEYPSGAPRSNVHPGVCYDCQRKLAKDDGILWRKSRATGRWQLKCAPGFGCQATDYKTRGRRPTPSASDIDALF